MKLATTSEEIKQALRTGYSFDPETPALQAVARDLFCPIIESMEGKEIIYVCRFYWLMRIDFLEVDEEGFRAVGTPTHDLDNRMLPWDDQPRQPQPLDFHARWHFLHMCGSAICMNMLADHFFPDPAVVAEGKAAVARSASGEIPGILRRAMR
jgi:hypothetical protein